MKLAQGEEEKLLFPLSCENEAEALERMRHIIHRSPQEFDLLQTRWRLSDLRTVSQDWLSVQTDAGMYS